MVPTSAHSGDGMGNLMGLLVKLSQTMLAKRISYSEELQATVLEVKAIPGLGTTIDIVLVNGKLREGQTMIVAGQEGPIGKSFFFLSFFFPYFSFDVFFFSYPNQSFVNSFQNARFESEK